MALACALLVLALGLSAPLASSAQAQAQSGLLSSLRASQFSGFAALLEAAEVAPELEAAAEQGRALTLLAPSDEALLRGVSPTLLAFLKLHENKAQLRQVLLAHCVPARLSPFHWDGQHASLLPSAPVRLTMDSQALYAQGVAVEQYNALASGPVAVHALASLILPHDMGARAAASIQQVTDSRRSLLGNGDLLGAMAPALAPAAQAPGMAPAPGPAAADPMTGLPKPEAQPASAPAAAAASALTLAVALAAAALLF